MSDRVRRRYDAPPEAAYMEDPTSDVGEVDPADAPVCAGCGEDVVDSVDHRVVTWVADGEARHRHFCDDSCLADWTD